ncbi:hypothetical protein B9G55_19900 [Saccharibacillus sp. O16]|nr:hypothetical protein B9G55_19900 [Saccharibacillus sp. O16]
MNRHPQRRIKEAKGRERRGRKSIVLMSALLFSMLAVLGGLTAAPKTTYACSCAFSSGSQEQLDFADLIFSGTVTERGKTLGERIGIGSSSDPVNYTFKVDQVWKGKGHTEEQISTYASTSSCGADFREGERYIVMAKHDGAKLTTSLCSGNVLYEVGTQPELLQKLGEANEPEPGVALGTQVQNHSWIAVLGMTLILVLIVGLVIRRRRARRRF